MLNAELTEQIKAYTALLEGDVVLVASIGEDEQSQKMDEFLQAIAELSSQITIRYQTLDRTPSFRLDNQNGSTGITFAAIPLGHELSSFVLALVQASGRAPKLEAEVINRIKAIDKPLDFTTYISLTCHICPDVVQALNAMAVLNPKVTSTTVDGGLFQAEVEAHKIMAVPTVMLDGNEFSGGRITIEEILDKVAGPQALNIDVSTPYDVLVIGGGPAGASAAIYAARKGIKVGIISDCMGGQVLETFAIENLIGTPYTEGPKLAVALETHMKEYPIDIIKGQVVKEIKKDDLITVLLESGTTLKTKTTIIATGARWRNVNVPGEQEFKNKGVAYCPHCDGPIFAGKKVAVIGGGNSGIEAAIDLAQVASHVTVIEFLPELKADTVLQERLAKLPNVTVIKNAQTTEITGTTEVNGLSYKDRSTNEEHHLDLAGVFVQIGLVPNTDFVGDLLEKTRMGEIIVNEKGLSSVKGIFAAGDCSNSPYKQIIISMGSGATAALSAFEAIMSDEY